MDGSGKKAVFLDRDGAINVDKHYLHRIEEFEYLEGAVEGMRRLSDAGFLLFVVTNQSGIARGYFTEGAYQRLDQWMRADLRRRGVEITKSYACPHLPDGTIAPYNRECSCRKPKTGLFWKAAREFELDMDHSFAVGDRMRDLSICGESGVKGFLLLPSGQCFSDHRTTARSTDPAINGAITVCGSWDEIVDRILTQASRQSDRNV